MSRIIANIDPDLHRKLKALAQEQNGKGDDEQMSCVICGHIAKLDDPYQVEILEDDGFPICPECGNWNIGGYPSFAPWGVWGEDERETIRLIGLDRQNGR